MLKPTFASAGLPLAAAVFLAAAPMARAQVQAPQIWEDWQSLYGRVGGTLDAETSDYAGGTLTLNGVTARSDMAASDAVADLGTITMTERDDGSVDIEIPAEVGTRSTTSAPDGTEVERDTTLRHENLSITAREDDGRRTYDIAADAMTVEFETVVTADGTAGDPTRATLRVDGIESEILSGLGPDGEGFEQTNTMDGVELVSGYTGEEGAVTFTYALTDVRSSAQGRQGDGADAAVTGLSDIDFTYEGTVEHAGSALQIAGVTPNGPLDIAASAQTGTVSFDLEETSLGYSLASFGGAITAQLPGFPLPVELSTEEVRSAFTLPKGEPGAEQPFGLEIALRDLRVDDMLWELLDPEGQLPRDPATVALDLDGTAVMNVDLFGDPEAMASADGPPGSLRTLTLRSLLVALAGAELRGSGEVTFPTGSDIPEPVGTLDLALDGGFALVDRLVALQVIAPQQAAFVKGMAGAVARSVGEDALESTIEFLPGGGITANGMPVK